MNRMGGKTSPEAIQRWKDANYKRYTVYLRYDVDREKMEWLDNNKDRYSITDIFRAGIDALRNN